MDNPKLMKLHYLFDKGKLKKLEKKSNKMGYELVSLNRGVAHFRKDGNNFITVKGTNVLDIPDLISDFKLGVGISNKDLQFRNRRNEIKRIYKNYDGDNTLIGHSLGGSIITNAMVKSASIRNNTKDAHAYNTGYTSMFHNELKEGLTPTERKSIKSKLNQYSAKGDIISNHLRNESIGNVVKVKTPKSNTLLQNHSLDNFIENNMDDI